MSFKFNCKYFIWFLVILLMEVLIVLFIKTGFIRSIFGDYLVVILLYCFIKSFFNYPVFQVALLVLLFAFSIELLQFSGLINSLGFKDIPIVWLFLGSTFQTEDLVAYSLGIITVILIDRQTNEQIKD